MGTLPLGPFFIVFSSSYTHQTTTLVRYFVIDKQPLSSVRTVSVLTFLWYTSSQAVDGLLWEGFTAILSITEYDKGAKEINQISSPQ